MSETEDLANDLKQCKWFIENLNVATWNVRGMANKEKQISKIFKNKINITSLSETKYMNKDSKFMYVGDYTMFYTRNDKQ